jgi:hypothetical protein
MASVSHGSVSADKGEKIKLVPGTNLMIWQTGVLRKGRKMGRNGLFLGREGRGWGCFH